MKKIRWIIGSVLLVWLGPWVLVWLAFVADDIAREVALWRYQPTSLADAVAYKHATPELVARFIDQGADVNQTVPVTFDGQLIPLVADASSRGNVEVTRLLLHRGARLEDANLWSRARNGNEEMARMLIEEGANLGRQPVFDEGIGPELIQAAAFGRQVWLIRLLLQKGADVQVVNAGQGLLALALFNESHDSLETTKALLAAGAHVNPLTSDETPPIYWAAYHGKLEEMDLLLAAGAGVDPPVERGVGRDVVLPPGAHLTALSAAVERCHYEAAEKLVRRGASTSAVIYDGKSLMEGACYHILDSERAQRDRMRTLLANFH